ncbi:MAG TPA: response regulator [Clostridiaceae bacterium]
MYRLLIVEDEEIEREGLRNLIDWDSLGIIVIGAVESGEEALEYIVNDKVDILLTDIKLIGISGIDLAQKVSAIKSNIKILIVSCMEDFDYAKKAIELGTYAYISKPIDTDELKHAITKVTDVFANEENELMQIKRLEKIVEKSIPLLKSYFLNNLIVGNLNEKEVRENLEYFNIKVSDGTFLILITDIESFENIMENKGIGERNLTIVKVLECINSIKTNLNTISFHVSSGMVCSILNPKDNREDFYDESIRFAEDIQQNENRLCNIKVTIGIGKKVNLLSDINVSYNSAINAINFKFFMGSNQIISYKDTNIQHSKKNIEDIYSIENTILSSIQLCNKVNLEIYINKFFTELEHYALISDVYMRNLCISLLSKCSVMLIDMHENYDEINGDEFLIWDKLFKCNNINDLRVLINNLFNELIDYLLTKRDGCNKKVVGNILKIVKDRYNMKLTLSDISKEINYSTNYISIIFKKETGKNFTDYLIKFRMEKAKKMLKDTDLKVYEIGNTVGYRNISYFCNIFKDLYGVSPNEYKEKIRKS